MSRTRSYSELLGQFREAAGGKEDPPRALYTTTTSAHQGDLELVGLMLSYRREMQLYALDPGFDPRRALRAEGDRRVSLTNYLNFASASGRQGSGKGGQRILVLWTVGGEDRGEVDTRVDLACEHIVAAHDFRVRNPAADTLRVRQAHGQCGLFWLDDRSILAGRVYNLEQALLRTDESSFFFSVCEPHFYGAMAAAPWGRGLPYVALNRKYVVAKKLAATLEELDAYLALESSLQPAGFAPEQLATWDRMPEAVRRVVAGRPPGG